jgi:hypothetical protein
MMNHLEAIARINRKLDVAQVELKKAEHKLEVCTIKLIDAGCKTVVASKVFRRCKRRLKWLRGSRKALLDCRVETTPAE